LDFEVNGKGEEGVEQGFDRAGLAEEFSDVGVGAEVADFDAACLIWGGREGGKEGRKGVRKGGEGGLVKGRGAHAAHGGAWGNRGPATWM
jgi:hypothetical protein